MKRAAALLVAVWLLSPLPAFATVLNVPCGDDAALAAALNEANTTAGADVITLNPTGQAACSYAITSTALIIEELTLVGNGAVITGDGLPSTAPGLQVMAGVTVTIKGLTLQNASQVGLRNEGTLGLYESAIVGSGAAGLENIGTATLQGVTLRGNGSHGARNTGSLTVTRATISHNAQWGLLSHTTTPPTFMLTNATISHNLNGGIMLNDPTTLQAANTLIVANDGPALRSDATGSTVTLTSATLAANSGEALIMGETNSLTVTNSIIWGNDGGDHGRAQVDYAAYNIAQGGLIGEDRDPLLMADYHLEHSSSAIDAGSAALLPLDGDDLDGDGDLLEALPLDLANSARIKGAALDMGAYEADPPPPPTATPTPTMTPTPTLTPTASVTPTPTLTPTPSGPVFADVPSPNQPPSFTAWIEAFYAAGITKGCDTDTNGDLLYCPEDPVSRGAMAVFILRALAYPTLPHTPQGSAGQVFADVPSPNQPPSFEAWIEDFYAASITKGCGTDASGALLYCPEDPVSRGAMAVFILRAINGPDYTPTGSAGQVFADVPSDKQPPGFEAWIEDFYAAGITEGCGTDASGALLYCPEAPVSRGAMALFILRAFDSIPNP